MDAKLRRFSARTIYKHVKITAMEPFGSMAVIDFNLNLGDRGRRQRLDIGGDVDHRRTIGSERFL